MAKNWWDTDEEHKADNKEAAKPKPGETAPAYKVQPDNMKAWWEKDESHIDTTSKKTDPSKIPRDKSIFERVPWLGQYITKHKDWESNFVDELEKHAPGTRAAFYNQKKISDVATDMTGSLLTGAVTGPAMLLNMATQGAYGGASRARDLVAEKGSDFGTSDVLDVLKTGGISSLGPAFGQLLHPANPILKNPPPPVSAIFGKAPTSGSSVEGIIAGRRADIPNRMTGVTPRQEADKLAEQLAEMTKRQQAAAHAQKVQATSDRLSEAHKGFKDSVTGALTRTALGGIPGYWASGGHPAAAMTTAGLSYMAPHIPHLASKFIHNQGRPALLQALLTSGAINAP